MNVKETISWSWSSWLWLWPVINQLHEQFMGHCHPLGFCLRSWMDTPSPAIENTDVPGTMWWMAQIPWHLKLLSSWHRLDYYSANIHCLTNIPCPLTPLSTPWMISILAILCVFEQHNMGTNNIAYFKLRPYKLWNVSTCYSGSFQLQWQEQLLGNHRFKKKEKHKEQTWRPWAAWGRGTPDH